MWFIKKKCHKNTKLFITHGGILSTQEAMYHAVPVVGIPFTSDQRANILRMERRNIAKLLSYKTLSSANILSTVNEVLNNPIYSKNVKALSKRYRDQPMSAMQRAIFWIEYVVRHGSAEHLNLPARDMDAYQTANLDILGTFLGTIVCIYLSYLFLPPGTRFMYQMLRDHIQAK